MHYCAVVIVGLGVSSCRARAVTNLDYCFYQFIVSNAGFRTYLKGHACSAWFAVPMCTSLISRFEVFIKSQICVCKRDCWSVDWFAHVLDRFR